MHAHTCTRTSARRLSRLHARPHTGRKRAEKHAISLLGTRGPAAVRGMCCRAKLIAVTRRGVPGKVWHPHRPGEAGLRHGAAAAVQSVPRPTGGNACHQCTREPTTPGDSRRRCQRCCGVQPQVSRLHARPHTGRKRAEKHACQRACARAHATAPRAHTHARTHSCTNTRACTHAYASAHTRTPGRTNEYTRARTRARTHACMHAHMHALRSITGKAFCRMYWRGQELARKEK